MLLAIKALEVAPSDIGAADASPEKGDPALEGRGVELRPRAVPDLHRVKSALVRVLPRRTERFRMADAHDRAALHRGSHRRLDRLRLGLAELPPAIGAPRVPMPAVRRDLNAR